MTELLLGAMTLPEPMLTKMLDSILSHQAIMRGGYMKQNIAMHGMLVIRYASPFTKNQFFWLYSGTWYNTLFKTFRYIHFYYCYCYRWYCYIIIIYPESEGSVDIWFHVKVDRVINGVNSITQKPLHGLFSTLAHQLEVIVPQFDKLFKIVGQRSRS